jgi:hypothetical protein
MLERIVNAILIMMLAVAANAGESPVDFDTRVIPVLTKAGCNTGACHGAAAGRGGFRLSLYGGDPEFDHRSIVHELEGRRVNLSKPDESLLLLKATESINHGGGPRLEYEGAGANLLRRWISEGTLRSHAGRLDELHVTPKLHVSDRVGMTIELNATALFSPGSIEDVTQWTVFTPEDPMAIEIDSQTATAKVLRRGRHIVVARYLDHVVPIEIVVPLSDDVVDLANEPRRNFIDDHILATLETLRLPVSDPANDSTFLRRVTLDLTGRLPKPAMRSGYVNNLSSRKPVELIDRLLASDEFTEYWTLRFAKLLRIRLRPGDAQGALAYHAWLKGQIAERVPYDQLARAILTASGDTHQVGPANFYRTVDGPRKQAEFTSELFMGTRLRCANCHNHPLDRWTQDDYHGLAAIFAKVGRGRVINVSTRGEVTHPRTGEAAIPRIPGDSYLKETEDGRARIAAWLTDEMNPFFARAAVNRLWKAMMGRGLVEPTDDLRATNPATHPPLLAKLAKDFVAHDYDLRHTLRMIAASRTYARSSNPLPKNRSDDRYYSHTVTRLLGTEVLADAITDVTGIADQYGDHPPGTRAVSLFDPSIESETLDVLGRCSREESCESSEGAAGGLTLKLHLFNGPLLNRRIAHPDGRLAKMIGAGVASDEIISGFYELALSRSPALKEQQFWRDQIATTANLNQKREVLEDFLWSLLTCQEFVTNH